MTDDDPCVRVESFHDVLNKDCLSRLLFIFGGSVMSTLQNFEYLTWNDFCDVYAYDASGFGRRPSSRCLPSFRRSTTSSTDSSSTLRWNSDVFYVVDLCPS